MSGRPPHVDEVYDAVVDLLVWALGWGVIAAWTWGIRWLLQRGL